MNRSVITIAAIVFSLSGCDEPKTVDYYLQNPTERKNQLERCELQDASSSSAACRNAQTAETKDKGLESIKAWQDLK